MSSWFLHTLKGQVLSVFVWMDCGVPCVEVNEILTLHLWSVVSWATLKMVSSLIVTKLTSNDLYIQGMSSRLPWMMLDPRL